MKCYKCGKEYKDSNNFCPYCGCKKKQVCQACGYVIEDENFKFCGNCGSDNIGYMQEGKINILQKALQVLQKSLQGDGVKQRYSKFIERVSRCKTFTAKGVSFKMVKVEGGTFTMGATAEHGGDVFDLENPTHQVTLSSYSIGQTEVTQALWKAVMGSNPSYFKGDNLPVENVSLVECQKFIQKLNQLTGQNFRLPTEAEWEFAARGGNKSKGYKYAGSNNIDEVAWYKDNSNEKTHPVGTKCPNELGIYDMSGNVWEWCQDRKGSYSLLSQINPQKTNNGEFHVRRGGGWDNLARRCCVSYRTYQSLYSGASYLGIRLCLSLQPSFPTFRQSQCHSWSQRSTLHHIFHYNENSANCRDVIIDVHPIF